MALLNPTPGSVSPAQLRCIHGLRRRRGLSNDELHSAFALESLKTISRAEASLLIDVLGGGPLPHPPGQKPVPSRSRRPSGATRMITPDQVEQIERLGIDYFRNHHPSRDRKEAGNKATRQQATRQQATRQQATGSGQEVCGHAAAGAFAAWLHKNFKVDSVRDLATADLAGQVIAVLKGMLGEPLHSATGIRN